MLFGYCRALAVGAIAIGSKAAVLAKSAGGAGSLLKGAGALLAAGEPFFKLFKHKHPTYCTNEATKQTSGHDAKA